MERNQIQGSGILQIWCLITFKEYLDSILNAVNCETWHTHFYFKGWGIFQADFLLTEHEQCGQQKGRLAHCATANMLLCCPGENPFLKRRASCSVVGTASMDFVRVNVGTRHMGLLFPALPGPLHKCWWILLPDHDFFEKRSLTLTVHLKPPDLSPAKANVLIWELETLRTDFEMKI